MATRNGRSEPSTKTTAQRKKREDARAVKAFRQLQKVWRECEATPELNEDNAEQLIRSTLRQLHGARKEAKALADLVDALRMQHGN